MPRELSGTRLPVRLAGSNNPSTAMQDRPQAQSLKTFDEFVAFLDERPDEERWELIDGVMELNATPTDLHQLIVTNILVQLALAVRASGAPWMVLPGLGIHLPGDKSRAPTPDVLVRPGTISRSGYCDDPIVIVEVLSPSTEKKDLVWKRGYYASLPAVQHYLIISQDEVLVRHHTRKGNWRARKLSSPSDVIELTAIDAALRLSDIYRGTGLV